MKKAIVRKIFVSMTLLIVFLMGMQLVIQNFLLEDIYEFIKISEIEKRFELVTSEYEDILYGRHEDDLNEVFRHYEKDSKASIIVIRDNFNIESDHFFEGFNYIIASSENGQKYKLLIDFLVDERGEFRESNRSLYEDEIITADIQNVSGTEFYDILSMKKNRLSYKNDAEVSLLNSVHQTKIVTNIELKVEDINLVNREDGVISYQNVKLLGEVKNLYSGDEFTNEEFSRLSKEGGYSFIEEYSGQKIVVLTKSIKTENGSYINIFSLFAVEKVSSAFKVLNNYYIYFLIFQIILVFILVYVYSRWITKPLINLIGVSKDIAELNFDNKYSYDSEDELGALSDSLENISRNLSATIDNLKTSNNELAIESIKKQENEDRMRNLLNNLSHEFKTPLGVISGFLEIINDKVYEKDPQYYMDVIEEEVDKLNLMVRETLELSKLEMGEYSLKISKVDLKKMLDSSLSKFDYQIKEKNIELINTLDDAIISCDKGKIAQVLDNLISNAIKYTNDNNKIEIELKNEEDYSSFYIRNYGVHFEEEDLKRVWDRFYVREKSRNKDVDGTGIGLTIVKNILTLHDADYGVKNIENGIEFYFSLKNI